MCKEKIKKGISESIDYLVGDVKLFSHKLDDFNFDDIPSSQMKQIRELLIKKLDRYSIEPQNK